MTEKYINARNFGAKGSDFTTKMKSAAGSNTIIVENVGDFEVGDEVVATKCYVNSPVDYLFERRDTSPVNTRKWIHNQPVGDRIVFEGYDGSQGGRTVYMLDFSPDERDVFRWSNDNARIWHENIKICDGFTELEKGIRVKINDFKEREYGCTAVYVCDDKMVAVIEKIEGNKIYLSKAANLTAEGELSHSDTLGIQKAVDAAIKAGKSVFLPNGEYTLAYSVRISGAGSLTFEGESATGTVIKNKYGHIDIEKEGGGSCFIVENCRDFVLKNIFMTGNCSFNDRDIAGIIDTNGGDSVWGFYFMKTNAVCLMNNENVYIENCHARGMSAECFYAAGIHREASENPGLYRRSIVYSGCTVEDCARNAFNNNDIAEHTTITNCRIIDVGGCSWEGASRFVKINGCYFRNAGSIALGNVRARKSRGYLEKLGTGQHIITGNYFEGGCCYGGAMFKIGSCATQITIQNNSFVNFNSNGVWFMGETQDTDMPCENLILCGNSFDMTAADGEKNERYAIKITAAFATVSDNQIYVRGERDDKLTGIIISDDVTKLSLHDNTVYGCKEGITAEYAQGIAGYVENDRCFRRELVRAGREGTKPMLLRPLSDRYRGWRIVWLSDMAESVIKDFDTDSFLFTLERDRKIKSGDRFYIYNPNAIPWNIHHNIIDGCGVAMSLETYSGKRAALDVNLIS